MVWKSLFNDLIIWIAIISNIEVKIMITRIQLFFSFFFIAQLIILSPNLSQTLV